MNTDTHTPDHGEPWRAHLGSISDSTGPTGIFAPGYSERIVACVNACAGMADPIVEIASLRNALRLAESALTSLKWTPLTERQPAEDDGNDVGDVEFSDGSDIWQAQFDDTERATHWRRITLP